MHATMDATSPMHTDNLWNPIEWNGFPFGSIGHGWTEVRLLTREDEHDITPEIYMLTDERLLQAYRFVFQGS